MRTSWFHRVIGARSLNAAATTSIHALVTAINTSVGAGIGAALTTIDTVVDAIKAVTDDLVAAEAVYPTLAAGVELTAGATQVLGTGVEIVPISTIAAEIHVIGINVHTHDGASISAGAEPYDMTDADTLLLKVGNGDVQTATFNTGDAVDIDAVTAAEAAIVINTDIEGVTASGASGSLIITPDAPDTTVHVDSQTATATALGFVEGQFGIDLYEVVVYYDDTGIVEVGRAKFRSGDSFVPIRCAAIPLNKQVQCKLACNIAAAKATVSLSYV